MRIARHVAGAALAAWLATGLSSPAPAQTAQPPSASPPAKKKGPTEKAAPAAQASTQAQPQPAAPPMPGSTQLTLLIQLAMAAVAQANMTGNYTVLHALAAPSFQHGNPPDKLSQTFEALRRAGIDIAPVLLYQPILTAQPAIAGQGLRLTGYYQTAPQNVMFDLIFVPHAGQWRLHGVSIATRPDQTVAANIPQQQAPGPTPAAQPAAKR